MDRVPERGELLDVAQALWCPAQRTGAVVSDAAGGGGGRGCWNQFWATGLTGWERLRAGQRAFVPRDAAEVFTAGPVRELAALKSQAELLQATLSQMRKRIEELEGRPKQQ